LHIGEAAFGQEGRSYYDTCTTPPQPLPPSMPLAFSPLPQLSSPLTSSSALHFPTMSSIQLDSFSAIDSISLINALLNTRSVNTEGRRLPNVLTLEDQDELSRLHDKCRSVERTLGSVPILETPLQRDRREKLIRCWNIDRPPRLMRAARGALFASSYAPRSGIDEPSKDDPITQLCLLSDKLMRFDWHMESWQMESATRHGMHPGALAMDTEVQDWYTAVFHRVRMTYE